MIMLVVGYNNTLNYKLSESEQDCFQTQNNSLNIGDDTTILRFISTKQNVIASVGLIANLNVVVVFLNHKEFRKKIPNIFIINQVSKNVSGIKVYARFRTKLINRLMVKLPPAFSMSTGQWIFS